jgi:hypothetical protein
MNAGIVGFGRGPALMIGIADCGLWIVDYGLWIVDCGLRIVGYGFEDSEVPAGWVRIYRVGRLEYRDDIWSSMMKNGPLRVPIRSRLREQTVQSPVIGWFAPLPPAMVPPMFSSGASGTPG